MSYLAYKEKSFFSLPTHVESQVTMGHCTVNQWLMDLDVSEQSMCTFLFAFNLYGFFSSCFNLSSVSQVSESPVYRKIGEKKIPA